MSGIKHDTDKPPLSLVSSIALEQLAKVLQHGAIKYGEHNWREGFAYSRIVSAAMRHLLAWKDGQRVDEETGLSHLAHCMANLMFLLEYEHTGAGTDDLWKGKKK